MLSWLTSIVPSENLVSFFELECLSPSTPIRCTHCHFNVDKQMFYSCTVIFEGVDHPLRERESVCVWV